VFPVSAMMEAETVRPLVTWQAGAYARPLYSST
jgi:hypothetical protein